MVEGVIHHCSSSLRSDDSEVPEVSHADRELEGE